MCLESEQVSHAATMINVAKDRYLPSTPSTMFSSLKLKIGILASLKINEITKGKQKNRKTVQKKKEKGKK